MEVIADCLPAPYVEFIDKVTTGLYEYWRNHDSYFQDLAVFSIGPLHPGGIGASRELLNAREWRNCRVLDIGCGNGTTMKFIESLGGNVLGVEPSPFMREAARKQGIEEQKILPRSIETLKLGRKTFDVILIEGVIGFVEQPLPCIEYLLSHLRFGGDLFICDWMPHERKSIRDYAFNVYAAFNPEDFIHQLQAAKMTCELIRKPVIAQAFSIEVVEAVRRARLFFPECSSNEIWDIVLRKIELMKKALPSDVHTERFVLRVSA